MDKKLLKVMKGQSLSPPPLWMMRQAGRYLPEYRQVRKTAGSFLELCYTPALAAEVTLQPIRRFGFDAAILFSDILVVPHALGRDLRFEEGYGPVMIPLTPEDVTRLDTRQAMTRLSAMSETLDRVKGALDDHTALIGFCGAPWTVAAYMIAGRSAADQMPGRLFSYRYPHAMKVLLDCLADVSADYLVQQINAGADVVQIFDSWAGVLDETSFEDLCLAPVRRMVQRIRRVHPETPVIGFPRGAGQFYADYTSKTGVTGLGLDWTVPLYFAAQLQKKAAVQGNLDPARLAAGGAALDHGVDVLLARLGNGPLVFNLGHGIMPDTPVRHVEQMVRRVRGDRDNG